MSKGARSLLAIAAFTAVYASIGLATTNNYYLTILTLALVWSILGVSWNILGGYAGQVSFGHGAFFGLGAFTVALLQERYDVTPLVGLPAGVLLAGLAGLVLGLPSFRLKGSYFSLAMLAFPFVLMNIFEWLGFHETTLPLKRVDAGWYLQFPDHRVLLLIVLFTLAAALAICDAIGRSQFGIELRALREDDLAAEAAGIDTYRHKMAAMLMSAAIAGAAGGLYVVVLGVVTPAGVFGLLTSAQALVVTLFGGVGALWGPVVGALVLIPLSELLYALLGSHVPGIQGAIFGLAIIASVLLAPEGILWRISDMFERGRPSLAPPPAPAPPFDQVIRQKDSGSPPILRVEGVSRTFGGVRAVSSASFDVRANAITGIIGPNGAGKSTLFNCLSGITQPDAGTITYRQHALVGMKPHAVCRLGVARTFQVPRVFPRMTVLENVMVSASAAPAEAGKPAQLARDALAFVGLEAIGSRLAATLEMRDARLLELARALASQPRLVLMDEPFAGLGQAEIADMVRRVQALPSRGVAVLIVEHTMQAMLQLAEHLIVLDHGSVLAAGPPLEVVEDPRVIEAYLGEAWSKDRAHA